MDAAQRQHLEATLRERADRGDLAGVATLGLESYGPEILGYMAAAGAAVEADETFAAFAAALWQALPRFRWDCSFRVWAYTIARRSVLHARRRAALAARRAAPDDHPLAGLAARVRSTTAPFLRTTVHDELSRLRATLTEEDQTLLTLRVDRGLEWIEIARIFAEADEDPDDRELQRRAAALRKRFERLKARLAALLRGGRPG